MTRERRERGERESEGVGDRDSVGRARERGGERQVFQSAASVYKPCKQLNRE